MDFSPLLADVMTIADECDSQLKQTTNGFIGRASQVAARDVPRIASAINREARR